HQPLLLVGNADLPDVTAPADMVRPRGADDEAVADSAHVIGVDLLTDDPVFVGVDDQAGRGAAERFGEGYRGAAVQDAEGLPRALVDGHATAQKICADLGELDAEVLRQAVPEEADLLQRVRTKPDRCAHFFVSFSAILR